MTPSERKRTRIFVDPKVQGALALRVVLYWIVCILAVAVMLFCWELLTAPVRELSTRLNDMWFYYGPALVASFLLLPLVVIDIIRISHRFAGPLVRMRAAMRSLARNERVAPISFREDDFWLEFAQDFNAVAARLQRDLPAAGRPSQQGDEAESTARDARCPGLAASVD
jgi:hypothetical protein